MDLIELGHLVTRKEQQILKKYIFLIQKDLFIRGTDGVFQVKSWLNNFSDNPKEKLIALYVLENILYRNSEMMKSAMKRLLVKDIKNYYKDIYSESYSVFQWLEALKRPEPLKIKFYGVDKNVMSQSSSVLLRKLTSMVNNNHICENIEGVRKAIENNDLVVFIDDFIGSGEQFNNFFENTITKLSTYSNSKKILYCPLLAMIDGMVSINTKFPNVSIHSAEIIDSSHAIFSQENIERYFLPFEISFQEVLNTLRALTRRYSMSSKSVMGRNKAMLSLVFEWGCPNQTTSLLYFDRGTPVLPSSEPNIFYPLVLRRG